MEKRKLLVVFGAGASFDSIGTNLNWTDPARPPLANRLFDGRFNPVLTKHESAGTLIAELRRQGDTLALEAELDRIQRDLAPTRATYRSELTALRFYLS